MKTRRRFITLVPFAGAALLAACSKETSTSGAAPVATPTPTPAPAPAPVTPAPATAAAEPGPAAAKLPMLDPADPVAVSLGYVAVASQADKTKFKNYVPGQACSNCSLYGAKTGESHGPCPLFAGKHVLAAGWCSAYVKKAG